MFILTCKAIETEFLSLKANVVRLLIVLQISTVVLLCCCVVCCVCCCVVGST